MEKGHSVVLDSAAFGACNTPAMPDFVPLTTPSVITEYAFHLVAWRDEVYDPMGSAVLIRPNLLLTARHVVDDYWVKLDGRAVGEGGHGHFACMALQELRNGRVIRYQVQKVWAAPWTDLALLLLDRTAVQQDGRPAPALVMSMVPPAKGSEVRAFGYHDCSVEVAGADITIRRTGSTSVGRVIEIHGERRDGQLHWPCFHVNARFDGGMSGGPVFNEEGQLCGLVCKNMPPYAPQDEHVSYVTSLWPMLGLMLDVPREGHAPGRYPVLDLARDGMIMAHQWDRVRLTVDQRGEVTEVGLDGDQE